MCIRAILLVGLCGGWINGQQAPPLIATSAPKTYDPNCVDKMANCWDMPESSCHAPYEQWARDNCPNRCGICMGPTTPKPECKNKLPDCEAYDKNVCTNPDYTKWVGENCRYYCRMCTPEELARMDAMQTTIPPVKCKDKVDCRAYGANACSDTFKAWSKDNCANYCGYCKGLPTPPPACIDHIPNCKSYDADTCTNPNYRLWAEDNCKKFCGLCPGSSSGGGNVVPTSGGNAVPVPISGRDVPVISYAPPTPPKPGKRHVNAPLQKRQFHASHHHSGQTSDCWDSNSSECQSETIDKSKDDNTTTIATTDILDKDFPGSEFKPRPTPDKNWDSKPSTEAPVQQSTASATATGTKSTSKTKVTASVSSTPKVVVPPLVSNEPTMRTNETTGKSTTASTASTLSSPSVPTISQSKEPQMTTSEATVPSYVTTESSVSPSIVTSSVATSPSKMPSTNISLVTSMSSNSTTATSSSSITSPSSTVSTASINETTVGTTVQVVGSNITTSSTTSPKVNLTSSAASVITSPTVDSPPTNPSTVSSSTMSTGKTSPMVSTHTTSTTPNIPSMDKTPPVLSTTQQMTSTDKAPPMITSTSTQSTLSVTVSTGPPPTIVPVTSTTSSTAPPIITSPVMSSTGSTTTEVPCEDTVDNCIQYGPLICNNDEYKPWAKAHCARFCKFCTPVTMTPFVCTNKKKNCNQYDSGDLCTALAYYGWSRENCYAYCGYPPCDKSTPPMG